MAQPSHRIHPTQKPIRIIDTILQTSIKPRGGGRTEARYTGPVHGLRVDRQGVHEEGL